jgi:tripartite-type tricarboxylate transporter receptor subunit TctC
VLALAQACAVAANYPERPIRVVAGWPAGGGSDVVARLICSQLSASLGQQVLVDNRAGAGNSIASEIVAKAPANGYTLQFVNANHTLNPFVYEKLSFDTERDFSPVSQVTRSALVLVVNAGLAVGSVKDLAALIHARPDTLAAATAGTAGSGAVTTEVLKRLTGMPFIVVPYKGGGPAMVAVVQGESQFAIASQASAMPFIKSAKVKVLATASRQRPAHLADVPTFQEAGLPAIDLSPWEGIIAPAKTPPAIVDLIYRHAVRALKQPEVLSTLAASGIEPVGSSPQEFREHIHQQLLTLRRVLKGPLGKPTAANPSPRG